MTCSDKLLSEIKDCKRCVDYLPHDPKPVLQYNSKAKILIAGQAPGRKVHESGIPFNDASGDRLRQWMGISKTVLYSSRVAILPMAFCFPGTGKSGDIAPRSECAQVWRKKLLDKLNDIELTIILGKYAMDYHIGAKHNSLTSMVHSWKELLPDKIILPHPSPRNNIWLSKNRWFDKEVIPVLQHRVKELLE